MIEEFEDNISFLKDKIEELKTISLNIKDFHQISSQDIISVIGMLLGIIFTIAGLGFLGATIAFSIMAYLALMFNPMGFVLVFFAVITGIISLIFLVGGFSLLFINTPMLAIPIIVSLFAIFIVIFSTLTM